VWILGGVFVLPAAGFLWMEVRDPDGQLYYPLLVLGGVYLLASVLGPVAAAGMKRGSRWARPAGWIAASVQTLAMPVFTPLGLYGLILLACGAGEPEARSAGGQASLRGAAAQRFATVAQTVLAIVIPVMCMRAFFREAIQLGYAGAPSLAIGLPILWVCLFLQLVIHECGHALAVKLVGGHIHRFQVGPLWWRHQAGRGGWALSRKSAWGGRVGWTPGSAHKLARQRLLVSSAGPLMNLICGLSAVVVFPWLGQLGVAGAWPWVLFSGVSGFTFLVNLWPSRKGYQDSDGATILSLLTSASFRRLIEITLAQSMSNSSGLRPREWSRADLEWTLALEDSPPFASYQCSVLNSACAHYLDSGDVAEAVRSARRFEALAREQPKRRSPSGFAEAVFILAFYGGDLQGARSLWARKPAGEAKFELSDWLAFAAISSGGGPAAIRRAWECSSRYESCGTLEYLREQLRILEMGSPAGSVLAGSGLIAEPDVMDS
jgi:hypothetical protein